MGWEGEGKWEEIFGGEGKEEEREIRTKRKACAFPRLTSVFFFPNVMSFSASRWASFALGHVVLMDSCSKSEVTRFRSSACRCEDLRSRCLYLRAPPAMAQIPLRAEEDGGRGGGGLGGGSLREGGVEGKRRG